MANLLDYLEWRGDLTWEASPFNEVDSLILSWLSYVALDGIVPEHCSEQDAVSIKEAEHLFFLTHNLDKIMKETQSFTKSSALLLKKLAESRRFSEVRLTGFVNRIDYEKETQFCAMTALLTGQTACAVFRGTDATLIGWKEDFNMSFLPVIPAQEMALRYLEEAASSIKGKLLLAGHSKGGNLAIYAGVRCSDKVRKRIMTIYNNDGPGFYDIQSLGEHYEEMLPKIQTYVPKSSIVGMLLEREGDHVVVKSTAKGFDQHDALSWQVLGAHFVTEESLSEASRLLRITIRNWLKTLEKEEREQFVDTLFQVLEMTQAKTVDDLTAEWHKAANAIIKSFNGLDKQTKLMLAKTVRALLKEGNLTIRNTRKKK
ncbi:MAG: DUF2974 domain-containing protein [Lachnospiraceae bacterium]